MGKWDCSQGKVTDILAAISIGDKCFIGANSVILPGVTLANNVIMAAGSVVTKSFHENNIIIGGNPARVISTWEISLDKNIRYARYHNLWITSIIQTFW